MDATPKTINMEELDKCLVELKELIRDSEDKYLNAFINEDEYLKTFIVGRKFNVQNAFDTAKSFMAAKHGKYRNVFEMSPQSVSHVIESGFFGTLKHRDDKGRLIGFMRIPKLDIKRMEFDEILRTAILMVENYWYEHETIDKGQVFIIDYSGYNFSIFTRYSFNQKLSFAQLFLNNYPTKIKEVHIYNNPKLVGITYSLIRPFLPEKLRKRIFLHGHNQENLLNHFSPDILPKWMSGNLSDKEAIDYTVSENALNGGVEFYDDNNASALKQG
ncbi:retinaldehyde-binding protein 1 [Folsomia candida]|uniref:Retinaldehyde-binding protein 1 n=1 Tax=Folsomia candida TaxID=158441 RepID=A0A226ESZ9_FOLCA|nr:retinaldehyde-binding protein 1 [Folsomia candida]XP_021946231.1 retinaldehyde-binding protein 1 [Folsomia candida]XP_021946232.1 retinaldehyde-binding protein 1 [Folsomia candida]OXA60297.1 Retinaldehyde-binding protein 1 [Folsomia candida]